MQLCWGLELRSFAEPSPYSSASLFVEKEEMCDGCTERRKLMMKDGGRLLGVKHFQAMAAVGSELLQLTFS